MTPRLLVDEVLALTPTRTPRRLKLVAGALIALGGVGVGIGFGWRDGAAGWVALLTATSLVIGLGVVGALLSAIFQLTGARWGRAYRRLAEASIALMPIGLLGLLAVLIGGNAYLPWVHEHPHVGGKALWLTRGFWDVRVLLALLIADGLALAFLYHALRRDFCVEGTVGRFENRIGRWLGRAIVDRDAEAARCEARLGPLAVALCVGYCVCFSLLGFDLIMALDPEWISTLFGAWYFIGHLFAGLAALGLVGIIGRRGLHLERFLSVERQADLATLLFAFCLVNTDFFWSQLLTIWYGNLPEETHYLIERGIDGRLPWPTLSWIAIAGFFGVPFVALLFRKIKRSDLLLGTVASIVVVSIFLARFIEIAPPLLQLAPGAALTEALVPLLAAALTLAGMLGAGAWSYAALLTTVPLLPLGDPIFAAEFGRSEVTP